MQKLKKKVQVLEPSLMDAGHLLLIGDALLLTRLFALCAAQMITVMVSRRNEKRINIRLDRLYLFDFFFELRTFIIEPLLLIEKSLLLRLQRLQARQFFIALHGKQCTSCQMCIRDRTKTARIVKRSYGWDAQYLL